MTQAAYMPSSMRQVDVVRKASAKLRPIMVAQELKVCSVPQLPARHPTLTASLHRAFLSTRVVVCRIHTTTRNQPR